MHRVTKFKSIMQRYSETTTFQALKAGDRREYGALDFSVLYPENPGMGENKDSLALLVRVQDKKNGYLQEIWKKIRNWQF